MKASHAHLDVSEANWNRMVEILTGALNKNGVSKALQAELMAIVETTKADIVKTWS